MEHVFIKIIERLGIFFFFKPKSNFIFIEKTKVKIIYNISVDKAKIGYQKLGWKYSKGFRRLTKVYPTNYFKKSTSLNFSSNLFCPKKNYIEDNLISKRKQHFNNLIFTDYSNKFLENRLKNNAQKYSIFKKMVLL